MGNALSAFERTGLERLAPRASVAGRVLDAWSQHLTFAAQTPLSLAALAQLGVTEERAVAEVLEAALAVGLVERGHSGYIPATCHADSFSRLALALYSVAHYRDAVHQDSTLARVVLTKPPRPCVLEEELGKLGWRTFEIDPTDRAFTRMVQGAKRRVVVMTPFFDAIGALWLQTLFEHSSSSVEKVLVLRSLERPASRDYPSGFTAIQPWLKLHGVCVFNYSLPRSGAGRETFHAKVILCDDETAYLGSSNINAASLGHSMEMGVELRGRAARDVGSVIEAVIASSSRFL
jgi:phosphatidylserine/phosphatidylglycerophosphate/cardiolipin synthase-like enzyme